MPSSTRPVRPMLLARLVLALVVVAGLLTFTFSRPGRQAKPSAVPLHYVTWDGQMAEFLHKCDPRVTAAEVERDVDQCQAYLTANGVTKSRMEVLYETNAMLGPRAQLRKDPKHAFWVYTGMFAYQIRVYRKAQADTARRAPPP